MKLNPKQHIIRAKVWDMTAYMIEEIIDPPIIENVQQKIGTLISNIIAIRVWILIRDEIE